MELGGESNRMLIIYPCVDCRAAAHQNANARPALSRIVVGTDNLVNINLRQTLYPASRFVFFLSSFTILHTICPYLYHQANIPPNSYCLVIVLAIVLYLHLRRENQRRDTLVLDEAERDKMAFRDLTDGENPYFRYVL